MCVCTNNSENNTQLNVYEYRNTVLKRDFKAILMTFLVLNKTRVSSPRYKYIYKLHFRFRLNLFSLMYNRSIVSTRNLIRQLLMSVRGIL